MNEFEKNGFETFIDNGDGWERIPNAKFMMRDEDGTEIEMTPNEVIKQLMQDNKSLEYYINNLQSKIDKAIEIDKIARKYFNKQIPRNIREQGFLNEIYNYLCDIEDILKEDK